MSIISSLATAISGLEANGQALGVTSDNIVNANTTGFKGSRTEFHSVLAHDLSTSAGEIGRGVQVAGTTTLYTQGPMTKTERGMDCAINGDGFFVLRGQGRGTTYTRDGSFRFDKDGWFTSLGGSRVQAYLANDGKMTGKLGDLRIPFNSIPAKPTKNIELHMNLDGRTPVSDTPIDLTRPDETSQFHANVAVFDSIGNQHSVGVYFNRTSDSTWEWHAMTDGGNLAGGTQGAPTEVAQGSMNFDQLGNLTTSEQTLTNTSFSKGAMADQALHFDFGNIASNEEISRREATTMYGSKHSLFRSTQDGWSAGYLSNTNLDADGHIKGTFTNGETRLLGKLAVARFEGPERLSKAGQNQYKETMASGMPLLGEANTSGRGSIASQTLEGSNIDLAKEFVDMIRSQRGFQASAKSISVANNMLDEVVNLYRN